MTDSNRTTGLPRWLPPWGLLVMAVGCNHLAPGIAPISSDPPSMANLGRSQMGVVDDGDEDEPWPEVAKKLGVNIDADSGVELGPLVQPNAGERDGRYVARQFPQPPTGYQPPPTYQPPTTQAPGNTIPPPSNYQVSPTQPPTATNVPPGGVAVPSREPLPPPPGNDGGATPFIPNSPLGDPSAGQQGSVGNPGTPLDPYFGAPTAPPVFTPNTRMADLELTGVPARTGRIMLGGAVNSDAGVMGQITVDERNFDIMRWPTSFQDFANGTAFRGAGQTFRVEAVPGSIFKRYTANFVEPNLFGYLPISLGVSGFLYDRRFRDYDEERLGGRVSFGYRVTPDLSVSTGITGQSVRVHNPRIAGVQPLDDVLGSSELYTGEFKLIHDTRDSPFAPSEGHFLELGYERAFGDFDYDRFDIENRNYLLVAQRADGSGKQTLTLGTRLGFSGKDTPLFENYFAGGYSTMRGFDFRAASPVINGVQVGGRFQWLNTLEYMFPITADDAFRGVAFVDFGTVERDIELNSENFRVAPGLGLRVAIPMLGPAPLAFDFAYPVTQADGDEKRIFSFYMSAIR